MRKTPLSKSTNFFESPKRRDGVRVLREVREKQQKAKGDGKVETNITLFYKSVLLSLPDNKKK